MSHITLIGQGLAGSILALNLMEAGMSVKIINQYNPNNTSSWVAAGIFNPITGKRMNLTWRAKAMFDEVFDFYPKLEKKLDSSFFHKLDVIRLMDTVENQNDWLGRASSGLYAPYATENSFVLLDKVQINNPFGGIRIGYGGYVATQTFLEKSRAYFLDLGILKEVKEPILPNQFENEERVVWCTGYRPNGIKRFDNLPHLPVKGELLTVKIKGLHITSMLMGNGIFLVPIANGLFKVGATYNWDLSDLSISNAAKQELLGKLAKMLHPNIKVEVMDHVAGVRPATKDRRPFIGQDTINPNHYYFSGFGSKGVSIIPFFAKDLAGHLAGGKAVDEEVDLGRF